MLKWDDITENGWKLDSRLESVQEPLEFRHYLDSIKEMNKPVYIQSKVLYKYGAIEGAFANIKNFGLYAKPVLFVTPGVLDYPKLIGVLIGPNEQELVRIINRYIQTYRECTGQLKH